MPDSKFQFRLSPAIKAMFVASGCLWFVVWSVHQLGFVGNLGMESGYYGQFNRVRNTIREMPDVVILNQWQHKDVTLEDFGFKLLADGLEVDAGFGENTPIMAERDKAKTRAYILQHVQSKRQAESML
jgi:hypothetical protein